MAETSITPHRKHIIVISALIFGAAAVIAGTSVRNAYAVGAAAPAVASHIITLHDDGKEKGFITKASTLRQALTEAKVRLDKNDRTEPGLDEKLVASSYEVNIYRARPVIVRDGKNEIRIVTSYRTARQIAEQVGITLHDEDTLTLSRATDIMSDGLFEILTIRYATPITFVFYGKTTKTYTQEQTVGAMLKSKNIVPERDDTVLPAATTPITAGMEIQLWKNGEQMLTVEEDIAYDSQKIYDMDQDKSYRKVQTEGSVGKRTVTYRIVMHNGVQVEKKEYSAITTKQPIKEVVVIGGKNNYSGSLNEWLYALRMCETHGRYDTNTGNGFYGAYQFMISTWNSVASKTGRGDLVGILPSNAAPADQDAMIIANTNMTAGLVTQNPGCYRSTGISNKPPAQ